MKLHFKLNPLYTPILGINFFSNQKNYFLGRIDVQIFNSQTLYIANQQTDLKTEETYAEIFCYNSG